MAGVCYSISDSLAEEEEEVEESAGEEEDMIIDLEGDVDIALINVVLGCLDVLIS